MKITEQQTARLRRLGFGLLGVLLALTASLGTVSAQTKVHLKIAAIPLIRDSFQAWTATTPWEKIDKFDNPNANRQTVELILEMQALKAGGLDFDTELVMLPNHERCRVDVEQGNCEISAETMWDQDIRANLVLQTEPIVRDGEYEKGLYVLPTNDKALKVTSLEGLRGCAGVMVATWTVDLGTLQGMQLKAVEKAPTAESMFLMLQKGRGDFTLMEFSANADMSTELAGVKLVPIPNCKVALKGSRSWVVSKTSPHAPEIHAALVKGVKLLRDEGRIERAFKESGFLNARVASWKRLY